MLNVLSWLWNNVWTVIAIFIVIKYGKTMYRELLFTPLAGGNGKVQMDELAKFVILVVFIASAYVEATRTTEYHVFSDNYFFALLLTVCAIAAIKPIFSNMTVLNKEKNDKATTN